MFAYRFGSRVCFLFYFRYGMFALHHDYVCLCPACRFLAFAPKREVTICVCLTNRWRGISRAQCRLHKYSGPRFVSSDDAQWEVLGGWFVGGVCVDAARLGKWVWKVDE